jgi:hypothetical protein
MFLKEIEAKQGLLRIFYSCDVVTEHPLMVLHLVCLGSFH